MYEKNNLTKAPLEIFTAADVEPKEVRWLWYPYIPIGKVTLIHGESGDGKSTFALNLAAILTRGGTLPFTEVSHRPMRVIYLNTEDDADDTVVPRFIKAGGMRDNLIFISEKEQKLSFTDWRIRETIMRTGARVCILDPLASYIGRDVSMNLANEVRPSFESLIDVARETRCTIIVVAHLNKAEGQKATSRIAGSGDIVAAARSAIAIGRYRGVDPDQRIMAHSKSNLAPLGDSILFSVGDGSVSFIDTIDVTADQLVGAFGSPRDRETKQAIASRELLDMLSMGQMPQREIMERMSELGISQRTCELAKGKLPIETVRVNGHSEWRLAGGQHGNDATMQGDTPFAV